MFAIVKTGGKQYKVAVDDVVRVEKLEAEPGATVELKDVLMVHDGNKDIVGAPSVAGASVQAEVVEQMRDRKVIIFKKTRRHNYRRKNGHRQHLTVLKIKKIVAGK
jgi:large subunit ribosomal protein L21